jgi:thioredoxin-like negative regulator of GroEL
MEILARLFIAASLILLGLALYWGWNRWLLARLRRPSENSLLGLERLRPGVPAILYFTTPDCVPCRTAQRPALERLKAERVDGLQIVEVDANARPDLAVYWAVLSVPTTFIIDAHGQPRRVNHGVTSSEKLKQQLDEVDEGPGHRAKEQEPRAEEQPVTSADNQSALSL